MIKDYRQLMLLSKRGLSIRQIARMAGCKWETARDALEHMKAAYGSLKAIPQEATSDTIRGIIRSMQETQDGGYLPIDCDEVLEKRRHGMPMDKLWVCFIKRKSPNYHEEFPSIIIPVSRVGKESHLYSTICLFIGDCLSLQSTFPVSTRCP